MASNSGQPSWQDGSRGQPWAEPGRLTKQQELHSITRWERLGEGGHHIPARAWLKRSKAKRHVAVGLTKLAAAFISRLIYLISPVTPLREAYVQPRLPSPFHQISISLPFVHLRRSYLLSSSLPSSLDLFELRHSLFISQPDSPASKHYPGHSIPIPFCIHLLSSHLSRSPSYLCYCPAPIRKSVRNSRTLSPFFIHILSLTQISSHSTMHTSQDVSGFSDIRSAAKDIKRTRDNKHKWEHGGRPGCGAHINFCDNTVTGPEGQARAVRPARRWNRDPWSDYATHNVNKGRGWAMSEIGTRGKAILHVLDELRDSDNRALAADLSPTRPVANTGSDIFYSFDAAASPLRPVPLEAFVKMTGRETEKLVEKEYEILDDNGDTMKGRKARKTLRQSEKVGGGDDMGGYEFV